MIVLVDVGNTRLKYSQVILTEFTPAYSCSHSEITPEWCEQNWSKCLQINIACVGHNCILQTITSWANSKGVLVKQVVSEAERFGITNAYAAAESLGVDRWLAMQGANALYPDKNILVVDAGTATTLDYLTENGHHIGGWIFPGINLLLTSVLSNTAKVEAKPLNNSDIKFGTNTSECLNYACWTATAGLIEQAIKLIKKDSKLDKILLLGGNAEALKSIITCDAEVQENLIFHGLYKYI